MHPSPPLHACQEPGPDWGALSIPIPPAEAYPGASGSSHRAGVWLHKREGGGLGSPVQGHVKFGRSLCPTCLCHSPVMVPWAPTQALFLWLKALPPLMMPVLPERVAHQASDASTGVSGSGLQTLKLARRSWEAGKGVRWARQEDTRASVAPREAWASGLA